MSNLATMGHALIVSHVVALIAGIAIGMRWMWGIMIKDGGSDGR